MILFNNFRAKYENDVRRNSCVNEYTIFVAVYPFRSHMQNGIKNINTYFDTLNLFEPNVKSSTINRTVAKLLTYNDNKMIPIDDRYLKNNQRILFCLLSDIESIIKVLTAFDYLNKYKNEFINQYVTALMRTTKIQNENLRSTLIAAIKSLRHNKTNLLKNNVKKNDTNSSNDNNNITDVQIYYNEAEILEKISSNLEDINSSNKSSSYNNIIKKIKELKAALIELFNENILQKSVILETIPEEDYAYIERNDTDSYISLFRTRHIASDVLEEYNLAISQLDSLIENTNIIRNPVDVVLYLMTNLNNIENKEYSMYFLYSIIEDCINFDYR